MSNGFLSSIGEVPLSIEPALLIALDIDSGRIVEKLPAEMEILGLAESLCQTDKTLLARALYWDFRSVSLQTVYQLIGKRGRAAKEAMGACEATALCCVCKSLFQGYVNTRRQRDSLQDGICPTCLAKSLERFVSATDDSHEETESLRLDILATMPYKAYLLTSDWRQKREAALGRANGRCQVCNASTKLHVHHRTYANRGHEKPEDLIVLCSRCHGMYHGKSG